MKPVIKFKKADIIEVARKTLLEESAAIHQLSNQLSDSIADAVEHILASSGRVIVTGIGKSADIGRKIASTLNSTGTPAFFMHAADAIHGDLGMVTPEDVVLCLSKSGNTPEIKVLVPLIRGMKNSLVAIVGNTESYLARQADFVLNASVDKEACPNNLAPTSSTTAQLAMGDALAVALLTCRGFTINDFARFHPGGALGKKLYLRVDDLYRNNEKPEVKANDRMPQIILEISSKRLGAAAVTENSRIIGIITDGDLRRTLQKHSDIQNLCAQEVMSVNPRSIDSDSALVEALDIMRQNNITQLLVTSEGLYVGIIHLHDILKEGII